MKIKVKDLEPNPFRKMESYPIDRAKVEALKISIKEKTFWDNILVRKHNNNYQLAYGHHRWVALKELGIKEIDVPVRDIDDATMVQIMAEENLNWSTSPAVMTQTILTAKEFLDGELAKYENLNHAGDFARVLFASNSQFQEVKKDGVGRDTLVKFLGRNWTDYKVREALDIIKDKGLDEEAIRIVPTMGQARVFRTSVKRYKIPKPIQRKIAKIIKEGVGKRDIPKLVKDHATIPQNSKKKDTQLLRIKTLIEEIDSQSRMLFNKILNLRRYMKQMEIEEIKGVKVWLAKSSLKQLFRELERLKGKDSV